ncbi:hypothetical protein CEXT_148281 [Caerostris extrusa]|uniref:Uncharacterized protein n=1 Tax=Caerostris extrusa TaxID=172846 RepID=A0AAV4TZ50_CAEEX|nr:hypothetical protein CEXT_148281 [Caerostris extrusa]
MLLRLVLMVLVFAAPLSKTKEDSNRILPIAASEAGTCLREESLRGWGREESNLHRVSASQKRRAFMSSAPIEKLAEKITRYYSPPLIPIYLLQLGKLPVFRQEGGLALKRPKRSSTICKIRFW